MHGGRELVFQEPEIVDRDQINGTGNGAPETNEAPEQVPHRVARWTGDKEAQTKAFSQRNAQEKHAGKESRASRVGEAQR
jgi:hypothetical protein